MANKPALKDIKKKVEEHEENLSDSNSSVSDIDCKTCGESFSNGKKYKAHLQGKKHLRKLVEAKYKAKYQVRSDRAENEDDDDEEDDDEKMHCEVCDKYFSSSVSYESHLKGSSHTKHVKKKKLKNQMKDEKQLQMSEVVVHGENDSDNDDFIFKPYATCKVCEKQFQGPESLKMHMESSVHKKKVKQSKELQKLRSELSDTQKGSDDEEFFKKCETCQKSFSGIVPYKAHMHSKVHQKNVERQKVAEELKESCEKGEDGYVCKECKKSFTDPLAFKTHLMNNSHEKQRAKAALAELLNAHPEIQFVAPFSKEGGSKEDGSDSDESDSEYYLICKLCHFSFTGPESAKDHVKSKKHISVKKEKKRLKEMKLKKEISASSDVRYSRTSESNSSSAESKSKNSTLKNDDFEIL